MLPRIRTDSGSRYNTLFRTSHGVVKETHNDILFQLRFPKRLGKKLIMAMLRNEQEQQLAFVKARCLRIPMGLVGKRSMK